VALRTVLVRIFHSAVRLYFRRIERVGEPPSEATGGRLFVSNHHNALVDPILVLTDAPCEISPIAKSTLWSIPGLAWLLDVAKAVPLVRRRDAPGKDASANDAAFERVAAHLASGGNVLIFPEGTSHSAPRLAPLRTGGARMLLLAEEHARKTAAPRELTYQAVALEFDAKDKFRSRCLVLWGPVRRLADAAGQGEERVRAVTSVMEEDLRELLVEGETHEERLLVARVAEMLANDAGHDSLEGWSTIGRQVELAKDTLARMSGGDAPEVRAVGLKVAAYFDELGKLGLRDWQLSRGRSAPPAVPLRRWVRRVVLAPLAVLGIALYAVPYLATKGIARLAAEGDVVSTAKLGAGLATYTLWLLAGVAASFLLLPTVPAAAAAAAVVLSPFAALRWLDAWEARTTDPGDVPAERLSALEGLRRDAIGAVEEARAKLPAAGAA
jgi:1-acyl-sn-glycerol-3-phosphate acyltransferase